MCIKEEKQDVSRISVQIYLLLENLRDASKYYVWYRMIWYFVRLQFGVPGRSENGEVEDVLRHTGTLKSDVLLKTVYRKKARGSVEAK